MPRYDLLPQHKGDDEAVACLYCLPLNELLPLLPQLLASIQDCNWPIAGAAWDLLSLHVQELEPTILEVLADTDETWKSNVMYLLQQSALPALSPVLRQAVERIAYTPTRQEITEEADESARALLAHFA